MKKFALIISIMMISLCLSFAFADVINPDETPDINSIPLVVTTDDSGNVISEAYSEDNEEESEEVAENVEEEAPVVEVESGETAETQEENKGLQDGKGGNPVGGIVAIVVVLLLVLLIAFLNRG